MSNLVIGGITTADKLNDGLTENAAYNALNKRPRPTSFSVTIVNASAAAFNFDLSPYSAVSNAAGDTTLPADVSVSTSVAGGYNALGVLIAQQKPIISKTVLQVNADADVDQFNEAIDYTKADFDKEESFSLKGDVAEARPASKDESLTRTVSKLYVLDESANLKIRVKAGKTLTVVFKIAGFLNRNW